VYLVFTKAITQCDINGWNPLHHAIDSCTFSERAYLAAQGLVAKMPMHSINALTTGERPESSSCLHLCCAGSDKSFALGQLAKLLIYYKADVAARTKNGNTPVLLAAGSGCTDVVKILLTARADINDRNTVSKKGLIASACNSSGSLKRFLRNAGAPEPTPQELQAAVSGKARGAVPNVARLSRYARNIRQSRK
jgi:ankyrin repeat protein